jgi:hypothetical protein
MSLTAEHISPDGILRFVVFREDEDLSLGFSGYDWHTHAELLVGPYGASEEEAAGRFVEDLLNDKLVIAISSIGGVVKDVWITDDPGSERSYEPEEENTVLRYWSGRSWQAS